MNRAITNNYGEPVKYFINDIEVSEKEFERSFVSHPPGEVCSLSATPIDTSEALAVHPKHRVGAMEDARKRGVPTYFDAHGRPKFEGRKHKKKYMQQYGYFNKDAGYGDAQPGQTKRDIPDQDVKSLY